MSLFKLKKTLVNLNIFESIDEKCIHYFGEKKFTEPRKTFFIDLKIFFVGNMVLIYLTNYFPLD